MPTTVINFVHANGFPARSYNTFFNHLPKQYDVIALDKFGHNKQFPCVKYWQNLVDELIDFVEREKKEKGLEKIVCVGHSFGGVISFIAACQKPELFSGLIMLDPPVVTGATALAFKLIQKTRWVDKISPAGKAKTRRTHWPLGTNVEQLFAKRKLFKDFHPQCLTDYVNSVISEKNGQLELTFSAEVEADIFRNLPANLSSYKNKLTIPAALVYGEHTDVFPHKFFKRFVKLNKNIQLSTISGGHMFPLEKPKETAKVIEEIIKSWQ